jgi:hypothetical protein
MINWKDLEGSGRGLIYGTAPAFYGGTEENHEKPVRISGLLAEIRTQDLPNTKQVC